MIKRIGVALASIVVLVFIVACDASDAQMERIAVQFTQPAIEVTAEQLYREFSRDPDTASDRYEGRRVQLTGEVFEVRDDDDFEPVVELDVGQDEYTFQSLIAQFADRHRSVVESWRVGQQVSMVCYIPSEEMAAFDFESVASLRMCQPTNQYQ